MAKALSDYSPAALESFSNRMPARIEDALEFPVVKEVISQAGETPVRAYLHFELMKLANLVSVGGNLNTAQCEFIATELIKIFPNETLADFKLCFQRGAIGQYGEIFRLDGIVIRGWMEKYLEEKYQVVENKLMTEKETLYNSPPQTLTEEAQRQKWGERLAAWQAAVNAVNAKPVSSLTDDEIRQEGRQKPKAEAPHPVTTLSQAQQQELHREWIRQNFDKYTADKLPTWKPEREWIEGLSDSEKQRVYKQAGL